MPRSIRKQTLAGLVAGIAILAQPVLAQKAGNPPGAGGGGSTGGSTGGNHTTTGLPRPGTTNSPAPINNGIYISGKVVMEDGTPPPESVTIERVCAGSPRAQAYTDQKGRFSFQMGQTMAVMQDASEDASSTPGMQRTSNTNPNGQAQVQTGAPDPRLANCELRALLAGFRSDTVNLAGRRIMDDPEVGTLVLHRLGNVDGTIISVTSLAAPKDAQKAYEKGRADVQKQKLFEAEEQFQKAVHIYPKYAVAWYELGKIQEQRQDDAAAHECYAKSLAADPKFLSPYVQLSEMAAKARNWPELVSTTERLIQLDPVDLAAAYLYNAIGNVNLGRISEAEKSARAGEKMDTGHRLPRLESLLAIILARKGDYAGAVEHMRQYLELAPDAEDAAKMKGQLAELERLAGENSQAQNLPASKDSSPASGPAQPPRQRP